MSSNVITFPDPRGEPLTDEEWHQSLIEFHARLTAALTKDRKQIDNIRMVLSIDDVMDICRLIEDKVGHEHFDSE